MSSRITRVRIGSPPARNPSVLFGDGVGIGDLLGTLRDRGIAESLGLTDSLSGLWTPGGTFRPGPTNTGHLAEPSWPGSFTGGVHTSEFTATAGQTYYYHDFQAGVLVGTTGTTANNVRFVGCRFQFSANVSDTGDNSSAQVLLFGDNPSFEYCTFQPSVANFPTPLTGDEVEGTPSTWVSYGKGYQYGINGGGGYNTHSKGVHLYRCNAWGFGNFAELSASTTASPDIFEQSWFHHGADPFVHNTTVTQFHNDVWLCNNGNYRGAQCLGNVMEIWGNTNCLAWQGTGDYNDAVITGNWFGGDQQTISLSASGTSARVTFTDNVFVTRIGRSVGSGVPLRGWAVSDSGSGSMWRRNKFEVVAGSASANYPGGYWGATACDGKFWYPGDTDAQIRSGAAAHATDYTG